MHPSTDTSTDATTARALAAALSTPFTRGLLYGGFATFTPELRAVDERIRRSVRAHRAEPVGGIARGPQERG